jgi:hypothetical protein
MFLGKTFFKRRSRLAHLQRRVAAEDGLNSQVHALRMPRRMCEPGSGQAPDNRSDDRVSSNGVLRRLVPAKGFALLSKAAAHCAICADLAFTNLPVAVLSWLVTQFFVGCAAYAEAMYPSAGYVSSNEALHRFGATPGEQVEGDHVGLAPRLAPDLKDLSGFAIDADAGHSRARLAGRIAGAGENGNIVWLNVTRKTPSRRLVSTALLVTRWLSRRRGSAHRHPVTVELRHYDRRTLRGAVMPRYGTE